MTYVLTHEYEDKSAFHVCGATEDLEVAKAWFAGNDENNVYEFIPTTVLSWNHGKAGWRKTR